MQAEIHVFFPWPRAVQYWLKILPTLSTPSVNVRVRDMVFNATFNNISVISWRSVLLVEETGVTGENYRPVASH